MRVKDVQSIRYKYKLRMHQRVTKKEFSADNHSPLSCNEKGYERKIKSHRIEETLKIKLYP